MNMEKRKILERNIAKYCHFARLHEPLHMSRFEEDQWSALRGHILKLMAGRMHPRNCAFSALSA